MEQEPDKIIEKAAEQYKRSNEKKFANHFLEEVYQSIIPVNKLLK